MSAFDASKASILHNINAGVDFSFKGSIDAPILELVNFLNGLDNYYTTSSCSGRASVFRSGNSAKHIHWLLVRHRLISKAELVTALQEQTPGEDFTDGLVTLKCEPFILHINCRDIESARSLHEVVTLCGFRESGIKLGNKKVILAVRTTANCMELPLAKGNSLLVNDSYLDLIIGECNARLASNFARIDKFLTELKRHFGWPFLQLLPCGAENQPTSLSAVKRWGHTCCTNSTANGASTYIIGGYGANTFKASTGELRDQRNLECLLLTQQPQQSHEEGKLSKLALPDDCVHAVSEVVRLQREGDTKETALLMISGGRQSPTAALSCLRLYDINDHHRTVPFTIESTADQPAPRWGHTVTRIRQHRDSCAYLLYGGRDGTAVYNDAYILHITFNDAGDVPSSYHCRWEKLTLSAAGGDSFHLSGRFSHAACCTLNVFPHDDSPNSWDYDMVVVHGGVTSLQDPHDCGRAYVIDPNTGRVGELFVSSAVEKREKSTEPTAEEGESRTVPAERTLAYVPRFGHTLTSAGAKCLLLLGGSSFEDSASTKAGQSMLLDLYIDHEGRYRATVRALSVLGTSEAVAASLPCQACRAHHQVLYDPARRLLQVVGGGVMTLAFGAHHCTPWSARLVLQSSAVDTPVARVSSAILPTSTTLSQTKPQSASSCADTNSGADGLPSPPASATSYPVLFLPAQSVKAVKVLLEAKGWLDKSQSIAKVEEATLSACNSDADVVELPLEVAEVAEEVTAVQVPTITAAQAATRLCGDVSYMALPLFPALASELHSLGQHAPSTEVAALLRGVHAATQQSTVLLGQYATRSSKRSQVNSAQKANELLLALAAKHHLPVSSKASSAELGCRYEVVGDVLMLPEHYLSGARWEAVLGLTVDAEGNMTSTTDAAAVRYRQQVFSALAGCFGLSRVARKAEIDSGPRRESKVRLLHPTVGMPASTGPGAEGWVTVWENRIPYSFDITRVMFCSGNVTERMRMAKQRSQGQVVVDLYCGVGYYTVPLLLHGGAQHVYACEWNPNSVLALRENLRRAGVSSRCTVHEGDNRVTSVQLDTIADRVLLGLLPSSVEGWPLAARALKATGGTIHVHENVHEGILAQWVEDTRAKFETLLQGLGKQLTVSIVHLERVKSYAPRVYHVVLDLECVPK
jgi:tRNA(Phe) wybutosine-synthesizing methylase Tyw3